MRIAICCHDEPDYINGPNVWLTRLSRGLLDRGHQVHVLVMYGRDPGPTSRKLAELGVELSTVARPRFTEQRVRWFLERVAESSPDVFVPNLLVAAHFAARWVRAAGIPTIGVLHSDDAFYGAVVDEFVTGAEAFRLSAVVCVSRFLESAVAARAPREVRVVRIPCGVPMPAHAATWSEKRLRIAYVGRLVERQKRIREVASALCRCVAEVPGVEAVLYGEGPERKSVERILTRAGSRSVRLAGRIESDGIQDELAESQGFVLLSDFEGLPVALMEAMACGVVPICLRIRSGVEELVRDGETGLLVADRDQDLVRAVRELRGDESLWWRLSNGARSRVRDEYSIGQSVETWLGLCRELIASSLVRRVVEVPATIDLPPVHPGLSREEFRSAPLWRSLVKRGRRRATAAWARRRERP